MILAMQRKAFYLSIKTIEKPFAYFYKNNMKLNGWLYSDVRSEYRRQGILDCSELRVFDNSTWSLCETYPPYVVLPKGLSDVDTWTASAHRSKQRLPVVTYLHHAQRKNGKTSDAGTGTGTKSTNSLSSGASVLTRSAQPLVGLTMKSCKYGCT